MSGPQKWTRCMCGNNGGGDCDFCQEQEYQRLEREEALGHDAARANALEVAYQAHQPTSTAKRNA